MTLEQSERTNKLWSKEEDELLFSLIHVGDDKRIAWKSICKDIKTKTYKQCRERYFYKLKRGLKFGNWTKQEDEIILSLQRLHGNKWSLIAKHLNGRSSNSVKNRYFGHLLKVIDGSVRKKSTINEDSQINTLNDSLNDSKKETNCSVFTPCDRSTYNVVYY